MRKFKGIVAKKLLIIVAVILIFLGAGMFIFSQKGSSNPKQKIALSILGLYDEYVKTLNDFVPELGVDKIYQKYEKDAISNVELNLDTNNFAGSGIDKAGISLVAKSDPKAKKMQMDFGVKVGNMIGADLSLVGDGDNYYLNIPTIYDKAFVVNGKTLGKDLVQSKLKEYMSEDDIEQLKDLEIDLYSVSYTKEEIMKDYFEYTKKEMEEFEKNISIEKVDVDSKILDKAKSLGLKNDKLEQLNFELKAQEIKPIMEKSLEFFAKRSMSVFKNSYIQKEMEESLEDMKSYISESNGKIDVKAFMEKDKLRILELEGEYEETITLYLLGEKNTTDKIIIHAVNDGYDEGAVLIELKKSNDKNEMVLDITSNTDDKILVSSVYNPKDNTIKSNINFNEDEMLTMDMKLTDIKKGKSYTMDITSLKLKDTGISDTLELKGSMKFNNEKPNIEKPKESVEILKSTKEEFEKIVEVIEKNVKDNYGPLLFMF